MTTVNAAVLRSVERGLVVETLESEAPRAGEVLVRMGAAGVCASDHHVIHGSALLPLPAVLGHEGSGTVEAVGPGVNHLKPGQRVILSFVSNCGHCTPCRSASPQLCDTNALTGARQFDGTARLRDAEGNEVFQMSKIGVFADYSVVPAQACFPIPDDVPLDVAALMGCSVPTGYGTVVNAPGIHPGVTVAVFGAGGVGLQAVQGARIMNAARIIVVDISESKLEYANRFGATDRVDATTVDPVEAIRALTGGGVDYAFDTFGSTATTQQAVDCLGKNGVAVIAGLAPLGDRAGIDLVDLVRKQKRIVGAYYGSASPHETFRTIVGLYLAGTLKVDEVIERRYPLARINEGFDALERGENGRGVVVFE
ncbi:MAG: Zn-dependent alcohol dehydrogenase [Dehalococcoidia bacterium]|nr:Zn-dependent alcohol dehydrogenase [Dehalococcoidia bacterium]